MAELRHKRIGEGGDQHGDDGAAPPCAFRQSAGSGGQRLHGLCKEGRREQQLHHRQQRGHRAQHGDQHQHFFRHCDLIGGSKVSLKPNAAVKPRKRNSKAMGVMRRQTVIGVEQLHAPGGTVGKIAVGGVPRCRIRRAAQEFRAQITAQQRIADHILIVAEIAEFVVFCLQQQHVVERDVLRVICAVAEQLAALQYDGSRLDGCAGEIGSYRPGRPGAHGVPADGKTCRVHIVHGRQQRVGIAAAAGAVRNPVAVIIGAVMVVKETEVGEIHQHLIALLTADRLECAVLCAVLAVVDGHLVIDVATVQKTGTCGAVAVFIQRKHDCAAPRQFDGVGCAGLVIVLIAVQQQYARSLVLCRCAARRIQLVHQIADVRFDPAFRHVDASVSALDAVGGKHAAEHDHKQNSQHCNCLFPISFHSLLLFCFAAA